jgi:hypothetical protein
MRHMRRAGASAALAVALLLGGFVGSLVLVAPVHATAYSISPIISPPSGVVVSGSFISISVVVTTPTTLCPSAPLPCIIALSFPNGTFYAGGAYYNLTSGTIPLVSFTNFPTTWTGMFVTFGINLTTAYGSLANSSSFTLQWLPVSQPVNCAMVGGAPPMSVAVVGATPSSFSCDGTTHNLQAGPSFPITLTAPSPSGGVKWTLANSTTAGASFTINTCTGLSVCPTYLISGVELVQNNESFVSPTVGASCYYDFVTSCTSSVMPSVSQGNLLLMSVGGFEQNFTGLACVFCIRNWDGIQNLAVSDSLGNTWTMAIGPIETSCSAVIQQTSRIYYAFSSSSGPDTFTVTFGASDLFQSELTVAAYQFTGNVNHLYNTGEGSDCNSGTQKHTATTDFPTFTSANYLLFAGYFGDSNDATAPGAGFSCPGNLPYAVGSNCNYPSGGLPVAGTEYSLTGVSPPTTFPFVTNPPFDDAYLEVGVAMGPYTTSYATTSKVVACNFFQFQCWWYPLMTIGMIDGFPLGAGMFYDVSDKGFLYLLLAGSMFGCFVCVVLGVMTAMLPVIIIAAVVAYSFNLAGRVFSAVMGQPQGGKPQ